MKVKYIDRHAIKDPFLDRRTKLIPCQKEMVVWWYNNRGLTVGELAKMFNVSRRTIEFTLFPELLEQNKQKLLDRGGASIYYDKEKHKEKTKNHREYKRKILKQ